MMFRFGILERITIHVRRNHISPRALQEYCRKLYRFWRLITAGAGASPLGASRITIAPVRDLTATCEREPPPGGQASVFRTAFRVLTAPVVTQHTHVPPLAVHMRNARNKTLRALTGQSWGKSNFCLTRRADMRM